MTKYVTTSEAAEIIGCVDSRVRQLLREGVIEGMRFGQVWMVERKSAEKYRDTERHPGPRAGTKKTVKK